MNKMKSQVPVCQSCGMPLQRDADFGTNVDSSKNDEYCHFCFRDGKFIDEGITMEQKIEKLVELAVSQMNMPEDKAREMAKSIIPTLKRWQNR
jgi:hypothetical protein